MDCYLKLAYEKARELERGDSRFLIKNKKSLHQGNKNHVLRGFYKDKPVVFKFYTDLLKPNSFRRKCIETLFLRHAADTGVVPELVFESDHFILIEEP